MAEDTAPVSKAAAVAFIESPNCVATLQGFGVGEMSFAHFHASLPVVAIGSKDGTVKLWRINSDGSQVSLTSCVVILEVHCGGADSVAFHASLPLVATGSLDGTAKLWQFSPSVEG